MNIFPSYKQWKRWSLPSKLTVLGLYVAIFGIILTILFWFLDNPLTIKMEKIIPDKENQQLEEIVSWIDEIKVNDENMTTWELYKKGFDEATNTDPYDVNAYLLRGQYFLRLGGLKGLPQAFSDYKMVVTNAPELADGHFGLGAVIYKLSLFELIKRQRFHILQKGFLPGSIINGDTLKLVTMPVFKFYPDHRSKLLLNLALREFQRAQTSKQFWNKSSRGTFVISSLDYMDDYIRAVRQILGLEPLNSPYHSDLHGSAMEMTTLINPGIFKIFADTLIKDKTDIIREIPPSTDVNYLIEMGQKMEENNKPSLAIEFFEKALILKPRSFGANFGKGNALILLNKFSEAIKCFDIALNESPFNAGVLFNREICRLKENGMQWPNPNVEDAMTFLMKDLNNKEINIRLGAILVVIFIESGKVPEDIYKDFPHIKEEFKLIKFPK